MRCSEVQNELIASSGERSARTVEHLESCPMCRAFARDMGLISLGFRTAAKETVPEATLGFAQRIVRLLQDSSSETWFEIQSLIGVGKRFVYAGLLVTLLLLLGLVLPSTSPVRAFATVEPYIAQPESAAAWDDPLFSDDVQSTRATNPPQTTAPASEKETKE